MATKIYFFNLLNIFLISRNVCECSPAFRSAELLLPQTWKNAGWEPSPCSESYAQSQVKVNVCWYPWECPLIFWNYWKIPEPPTDFFCGPKGTCLQSNCSISWSFSLRSCCLINDYLKISSTSVMWTKLAKPNNNKAQQPYFPTETWTQWHGEISLFDTVLFTCVL